VVVSTVSGFWLGIDYGTSNTVAMLRWPDGRVRPLLFDGVPVLPSAVFVEADGRLLVGRDAERSARLDPARFEPNPKRRIDDGDLLLGGAGIAVVDLIAGALRRVADESARGTGGARPSVVLTHPASWAGVRRGVLIEAAERAGLGTPLLVPEPVAAARYYATSVRDMLPGRCLLVYDLGAGTFDASVLRRTIDGFEVVAVGGLDDFGGVDLDAPLIGQLAGVVAASAPDEWRRLTAPTTLDERRHFRTLWDDARSAKETLSRQPACGLYLPLVDRDLHVTREAFERTAAPALSRTVDATLALLATAGVQVNEVSDVLLVGGSTRMPLVGTLLHRRLGIPPTLCDQPELVVAEGALAAAGATPFDVAPVTGAPLAAAATMPAPAPVSPDVGGPFAAAAPVSAIPVSAAPAGTAAITDMPLAVQPSTATAPAAMPGAEGRLGRASGGAPPGAPALLAGVIVAGRGGRLLPALFGTWIAVLVLRQVLVLAGVLPQGWNYWPSLRWVLDDALPWVVALAAGVGCAVGRWLPGIGRYVPLAVASTGAARVVAVQVYLATDSASLSSAMALLSELRLVAWFGLGIVLIVVPRGRVLHEYEHAA
jgi:hypothetical protein